MTLSVKKESALSVRSSREQRSSFVAASYGQDEDNQIFDQHSIIQQQIGGVQTLSTSNSRGTLLGPTKYLNRRLDRSTLSRHKSVQSIGRIDSGNRDSCCRDLLVLSRSSSRVKVIPSAASSKKKQPVNMTIKQKSSLASKKHNIVKQKINVAVQAGAAAVSQFKKSNNASNGINKTMKTQAELLESIKS